MTPTGGPGGVARGTPLGGVWLLALCAALLGGCRAAALPEPASPAARLYAKRCGGCHRPYDPGTMTAAMWAVQVDAMAPRMRAAGTVPLSVVEREQILDYLRRHALSASDSL
ncbi:MAG: diheme cytochrome c, partial [Deltaproteobacteria bacterium]|nr:diheme cytochrome c [Deltaproteobacteria bacterium]